MQQILPTPLFAVRHPAVTDQPYFKVTVTDEGLRCVGRSFASALLELGTCGYAILSCRAKSQKGFSDVKLWTDLFLHTFGYIDASD